MEVKTLVENYLKKKIWRVNENANQKYSFSAISWRISGDIIEEYTLKYIYPKKISKAHINGDFHIHNLYMGICGYCCGWSLIDILMKRKPKTFSEALCEIANFLGVVSNEWAGAQALNSVDILLAPFIKKDNLSFKEVKLLLKNFIKTINTPSRWGGQTPFINFSLDIKIPKDLAERNVIIGGEPQKEKYKKFQKEVDIFNKAFCEIMIQGDEEGNPYSFPIPTYNITKDFNWNSEISKLIFEMTAKYGIPYFQNFVKSNLDPHSVRSMCCHLRLDLTKLKYRRVGGYFGYQDKTGSIGVVTINLPRIGYVSKTKEEFFKRLKKLINLAYESLQIKRKIVERNIKQGLFPYTKKYLGTLKYHFSTIGIIGMNEACINFLGENIATKKGKWFAIEVLNFINNELLKLQKKSKILFNLEATPAEGCCYRLAMIDKKKYPRIRTAGIKIPYYTNSTWLPVNYTDDLFFALDHQNDLQKLYTGGTVFHIFLGERCSAEDIKRLVKKVIENYEIPYFTITPTFSVCEIHGYISGEHKKCPKCGKSCKVYSRVVGYLSNVGNWNIGKKEEFKERKMYKV